MCPLVEEAWSLVQQATREREQRKQRWEKKHGSSMDGWAVLYLMEKPRAVAHRRLTTGDIERIEHMLAWTFEDHSDDELEALTDEIMNLSRLGETDQQLEDLFSDDPDVAALRVELYRRVDSTL